MASTHPLQLPKPCVHRARRASAHGLTAHAETQLSFKEGPQAGDAPCDHQASATPGTEPGRSSGSLSLNGCISFNPGDACTCIQTCAHTHAHMERGTLCICGHTCEKRIAVMHTDTRAMADTCAHAHARTRRTPGPMGGASRDLTVWHRLRLLNVACACGLQTALGRAEGRSVTTLLSNNQRGSRLPGLR